MSNIKIQSYDGNTYTSLLPQNSASITTYSNTKTGISATNVQDAIDSCFTSVSNRKSLIASAITDMGVSTGQNDSFNKMAENIKQIQQNTGNYVYENRNYILKKGNSYSEELDRNSLNYTYLITGDFYFYVNALSERQNIQIKVDSYQPISSGRWSDFVDNWTDYKNKIIAWVEPPYNIWQLDSTFFYMLYLSNVTTGSSSRKYVIEGNQVYTLTVNLKVTQSPFQYSETGYWYPDELYRNTKERSWHCFIQGIS